MDFSDPITLAILFAMGMGLLVIIFFMVEDEEENVAIQRSEKLERSRMRGDPNDEKTIRRRRAQEQLNALRDQGQEKRKIMLQKDVGTLIERSGLGIDETTFYLASAVLGLVLGGLVYMSGFEGEQVTGLPFLSNYALSGIIGFGGAYTVPQMILKNLGDRRFKLLSNQFADAIDMIVRGVKSGLPLQDCMRTIAAETSPPMSVEFGHICDDLKMGTTLDRALAKFFKRVPLAEVNFFVIALTIQAKAGGNLSEALSNLSSVIRSRKLMREKIKALASEALASALIIGALPFIVGLLVYFTSPDYISLLFTDPQGNVFLMIGIVMMGMGIKVMQAMMSFEI